MHEIMREGLVVAIMDVYKDFFYYGDGVHQVCLTKLVVLLFTEDEPG